MILAWFPRKYCCALSLAIASIESYLLPRVARELFSFTGARARQGLSHLRSQKHSEASQIVRFFAPRCVWHACHTSARRKPFVATGPTFVAMCLLFVHEHRKTMIDVFKRWSEDTGGEVKGWTRPHPLA
jgi:hypothetical protein